ncbi:NlpC/P60 family protein [Caulobacter sp. 1776]|uniref:NlpC/P60 family protein n=1 Tax=Caulobacter sp. 1776 TaxID=3156420 RepID=UPI003394FA2D
MSLVTRAAGFVGTPYRLMGRTPEGWDCWGCVSWLRQQLLEVASPSAGDGYLPEDAVGGRLIDTSAGLIAASLGRWRLLDGPRPGAVALIEVFGRPAHVGLVLDRRAFIHAWEGTDTVIERLSDERWARRARGFYDA